VIDDGGQACPADLLVSFSDQIGGLEINRPPANYFDLPLIRSIADALEEFASRGARVVVLSSGGKHFCAGANFGSSADGAGDARPLYEQALRILEQPLPLVAAVQGGAIGGGLGLAAAADFRVASTDAWFAASFVRLGFHHGFALTATLPRLVGQQRSLDMLYTGRRVLAQEALDIGLCDYVVPPDVLREETLRVASAIAASAPIAVRSIRETMRGELLRQARAAVDREAAQQSRCMLTADFAEGIAASRGRRTPRFVGA
jgi:enoyl-CoA hydratase/carnithine racemase